MTARPRRWENECYICREKTLSASDLNGIYELGKIQHASSELVRRRPDQTRWKQESVLDLGVSKG